MREQTSRATLYLMVGYPGSGKTTTSQIIHEITGATHIWADHERRKMFGTPSHSPAESKKLYAALNQQADRLLSEGKSVIFDTNFNFRDDRTYLRDIAANYGADIKLVWIRLDRKIALERAQHERHADINKYSFTLPTKDFERMANHLQPPQSDEQPIVLDGTKISREYVASMLEL